MKPVYFIIGIVSMLLGAVGVVLPVLPTTPFLLLSAWCFAKSSRRFHCWFISTALYKNHLDSFVQHRSMTWRTKLSLLAVASTMLLFAMYFMSNLWLQAAAGSTGHGLYGYGWPDRQLCKSFLWSGACHIGVKIQCADAAV